MQGAQAVAGRCAALRVGAGGSGGAGHGAVRQRCGAALCSSVGLLGDCKQKSCVHWTHRGGQPAVAEATAGIWVVRPDAAAKAPVAGGPSTAATTTTCLKAAAAATCPKAAAATAKAAVAAAAAATATTAAATKAPVAAAAAAAKAAAHVARRHALVFVRVASGLGQTRAGRHARIASGLEQTRVHNGLLARIGSAPGVR